MPRDSVHTAATTGHNVHEMNIDRNGPICKFGAILSDFWIRETAGSAKWLCSKQFRKDALHGFLGGPGVTGESSMEMGCGDRWRWRRA